MGKQMKKHRPYIDSHLNLGFMGWQTEVMHENFDRNTFTYIALRWYFFKWDGSFRLYKTHEAMR